MSAGSRSFWNFYSAGRIVFGPGAIRKLGDIVRRRKLDRVLIITDRQLDDCGVLDQVMQQLQRGAAEVEAFREGQAEPEISVAEAAIEHARAFEPQAIVGLGGGSNLDLSKITAAVFTHGGHPSDYFGFDQLPGPVLPLICLPTTSGTGSEVSHAAVLTDTAAAIKVSTLSPFLRPACAVVDPELTYSCPPQATADSGIDALTHAIEAYTAIDYQDFELGVDEESPYDGRHPLGDILAEKAIRLISQHLPTAVHEPRNAAAREGMALAATTAGLAFSNCAVAVVHALEYPVGAAVHCSHGAGNGLLLPYVMQYNREVRVDRLADIAGWMGVDTQGLSAEQAADAAIQAVVDLRKQIGIPHQLRELGATREQLPEFARKSAGIDRLMKLNPRLPTEAELLGVLEAAW